MKRKALKGLLIVLLVLILCYFFSGTIKTLTTAKVQLATVQRGKLRDQITLTGYLTFSDTEGITIDNPPSGIALTVTKIHVTKGSFVAAGDLLFETEISGIADSIREQEKIYQEAEKSLLALERQYATLRITRTDQAWIDAYDALLAAKQNSHDAHVALEVAAKKQEFALRDGRIPDGTEDAALLTAQAAADRADQEVESAQAAMDRASRIGISNDAYQYTMQSRSLNDTMNQANAEIIALRSIEGSMTQVRAAHPGYVLGIQVSEGSPWDGRTAAMILSAEDTEYLLRANITGVARTIQPGTAVVISGRSDNQIKSSVVSAGYDSSGNPYIDVSIGQSDIAAIGTAYRLMNTGVSFSINYVADINVYVPISKYAMQPLKIGPNSPLAIETAAQAVIVNPYSKHKDTAIQYLEYLAEQRGEESYTIYSNMTDPLIDAYVQSMLEEIERKISALQAAEMTEEVASMLQDLEEQREYYAENLYAVDLDDIAAWKASGPAMLVQDETLYTDQINSLINRMVTGGMSVDVFISECNRYIDMVYAERQ